MVLLVYLTAISSVYVATFNSEFKEEDLQEALPIVVVAVLLILLVAFLGQ